MAKKWTKGIVGLAAIGAAAAGILYKIGRAHV